MQRLQALNHESMSEKTAVEDSPLAKRLANIRLRRRIDLASGMTGLRAWRAARPARSGHIQGMLVCAGMTPNREAPALLVDRHIQVERGGAR